MLLSWEIYNKNSGVHSVLDGWLNILNKLQMVTSSEFMM